jgi:hypothetical protein
MFIILNLTKHRASAIAAKMRQLTGEAEDFEGA